MVMRNLVPPFKVFLLDRLDLVVVKDKWPCSFIFIFLGDSPILDELIEDAARIGIVTDLKNPKHWRLSNHG